MPTYTCFAARGFLSAEQRQRIAAGITRIHSEATGTPIAFTQCIFQDIDDAGHFIGGAPAPRESVWVYGHLRDGRTAAVKAQILAGVRDLVIEVAQTEPYLVWVYINELAHTDMVEFGHVLPEQGHEARWLEQLPDELRDHLIALGDNAFA